MQVKQEEKDVTRLRAAVRGAHDEEAALKTLAKTLVDLSGETAIVAFDPRWSYYTGVSNLFQKPDFQDLQVVQALSEIVDRFDQVLSDIFETVSSEPQVFLGEENPFGENMAAVMVKYHLPNRRVGLLGLVGPVRMDYAKNVGLMEGAKEALDQEHS